MRTKTKITLSTRDLGTVPVDLVADDETTAVSLRVRGKGIAYSLNGLTPKDCRLLASALEVAAELAINAEGASPQ